MEHMADFFFFILDHHLISHSILLMFCSGNAHTMSSKHTKLWMQTAQTSFSVENCLLPVRSCCCIWWILSFFLIYLPPFWLMFEVKFKYNTVFFLLFLEQAVMLWVKPNEIEVWGDIKRKAFSGFKQGAEFGRYRGQHAHSIGSEVAQIVSFFECLFFIIFDNLHLIFFLPWKHLLFLSFFYK